MNGYNTICLSNQFKICQEAKEFQEKDKLCQIWNECFQEFGSRMDEILSIQKQPTWNDVDEDPTIFNFTSDGKFGINENSFCIILHRHDNFNLITDYIQSTLSKEGFLFQFIEKTKEHDWKNKVKDEPYPIVIITTISFGYIVEKDTCCIIN